MEKVDGNKVVAYLQGLPLAFSIKIDTKDKDVNKCGDQVLQPGNSLGGR